MKDPYQVLGVSETASDDEIKRAYRNLARNTTRTITMTILWRIWLRKR